MLNEATGGIITGGRRRRATVSTGADTLSGSAPTPVWWLVSAGASLTIGSVSSSGTFVVGGLLDAASPDFEGFVRLAGKAAILELAGSQTYFAAISGLGGGDTLDLVDIGFTGGARSSYAGGTGGGTLTVTDGTHTAAFVSSGTIPAAPSRRSPTGMAAWTSHSRRTLASRPSPRTSRGSLRARREAGRQSWDGREQSPSLVVARGGAFSQRRRGRPKVLQDLARGVVAGRAGDAAAGVGAGAAHVEARRSARGSRRGRAPAGRRTADRGSARRA